MNKKKVLIVNAMHESILPMLEDIGLDVNYQPDINRDEILNIIASYQGIIVRSKLNLDREFFEAAHSLEFIGRAGAGLDQIELSEVEERNIKVFNAPEGNRDALAEHCLGLLLGLLHKIVKSDDEVRKGIWNREDNRGFELKSKTIGIIGFGYMGKAFAEKLIGFGCKVLANDIKPSLELPAHVEKVSLEELKERADIISLHVPLNEKTFQMVNKNWIDSFKKNIWLINTSRGKVINQNDLISALESGKIVGAALDVLENERFSELNDNQKEQIKYLSSRNNTIITPHVGGWSHESYVKINEVIASKIANYLLQIG